MSQSSPCSQESMLAIEIGHTQPQEISDELICLEEADEHYCAYSDVAQLWKRQMKSTGRMVAIKGFRMITTDGVKNINQKFEIALLKLVTKWQSLDHQNIMPCLGVTLDYGLVASLVIPMCPDGSINEYVKEHPNANKLALLSQVAGGVAYLHSQGVVHGKICGRNIVIAPNGRPLITDTGLTQVIQAQEGIFPWRLPSESVRWMAPELFASELDDAYTTSSDMWALAMTILEVMSGEMPYHPRRQVHATALAIMDGVLPQRPDNGIISDDLWDALNMMWTRNPDIRPHAPFVQWQLDVLRHDMDHHLYKL
ncbi:kinase-like protein [Athelia psychrophila]|uniref:Kinase-like protein n=1 Tax=Athelia psychrophila TaxID=1759441 RepID=A0A166Q662_9AGAM|nr:kinase-like protein [Fibularhizoctonia sp. CBS 109695]